LRGDKIHVIKKPLLTSKQEYLEKTVAQLNQVGKHILKPIQCEKLTFSTPSNLDNLDRHDLGTISTSESEKQDETESCVSETVSMLKRCVKSGTFPTNSISYLIFNDTLTWHLLTPQHK